MEVRLVAAEGVAAPIVREHRQTLGTWRRLWAWALIGLGLPLLTWALLHGFDTRALHITLFAYLLTAVVVGAIGGVQPAAVAAIGGFLLANWYFTPPVRTWTIADMDDLFSLFTFLVVALVVGYLVGIASRRSAEARRARAQAEALAATSAHNDPRFGPGLEGIALRIREAFSVTSVGMLRNTENGWESLAHAGSGDMADPDHAAESIPLTDGVVLVLSDGRLSTDDRRVLRAFATQATQAIERAELEREASAAAAMAETDRLRTALLRAVSHDLRTPLAAIKASVTSLLETEVSWTDDQTLDFLRTILEETERLNRLVGRLLDAGRVQAGAIPVSFQAIELEEVVETAVDGLGPGRFRVVVEIPEILPPVRTDGALLERVVANLVENALTWSPTDSLVLVIAGPVDDRIQVRVVDRGPGIPEHLREEVFQPFQQLGDSSRGGGVGLGLAVARGFLEAMGNDLLVEDTLGGGTTMVITLDVARPVHAGSNRDCE